MNPIRLLAAALLLPYVGGCAVNAVTGERNFQVYGTRWERDVGTQMYRPMKLGVDLNLTDPRELDRRLKLEVTAARVVQ